MPAETLAFAGVKPGQVVADLVPGDGYYTRIFSHIVGPRGHVYPFVPVVGGLGAERKQQADANRPGIQTKPLGIDTILSVQDVYEYSDNVTALWAQLTQYGGQFPLPAQANVVWTYGGYHDLHMAKYKGMDLIAIDKAIFRALRPDGTFVIAGNEAAKGSGVSSLATMFRIESDTVKAEVTAAGFLFDGESSLLSNPLDDHSKKGIDPSLQGRPDRFLLRFKKPATATGDQRPPANTMKNYYGNTYIYNLGEETERHHFYYPDGRYQEFGANGKAMVQEGTWYWDADGHNCQLHQYPADQRGEVVCHSFVARELNVVGQQDNGYDPPLGAHATEIIPGYHALPH